MLSTPTRVKELYEVPGGDQVDEDDPYRLNTPQQYSELYERPAVTWLTVYCPIQVSARGGARPTRPERIKS
eukprot:2206177-Pyramimonas_sp.AAC.1